MSNVPQGDHIVMSPISLRQNSLNKYRDNNKLMNIGNTCNILVHLMTSKASSLTSVKVGSRISPRQRTKHRLGRCYS
eukprot:28161-Prorocentrum_lima.AAC.1